MKGIVLTVLVAMLVTVVGAPSASAIDVECASVNFAGESHGDCVGIVVMGESRGRVAVTVLGAAYAPGHGTAIVLIGGSSGWNSVSLYGCADGGPGVHVDPMCGAEQDVDGSPSFGKSGERFVLLP